MMRNFISIIILAIQIGWSCSDPNEEASNVTRSRGTRSSLSYKPVNRNARCTPCDQDLGPYMRSGSNSLNSDYRGNGADNLGYDWSPRAWGGLAFPRKSKMFVGGKGRDGRQMSNWNQNAGGPRIICDNCRYYSDGSSGIPDNGQGRYFRPSGRSYYIDNVPRRWQGGPSRPQDFETRVSSATVGVLVRPGSRIAYIPSRSGDMYWDGVSGGGTRWDGFSNGISWLGNRPSDWNTGISGREDRPGGALGSQRDYSYVPNSIRPWNRQKGISDYDGRGYHFGNSNRADPQWRPGGYASNWHHGSTNQNGWNGNNMKWSYESKWGDNDRSANRFYFNSPQERGNEPDVYSRQYGNQYPNYELWTDQPRGYSSHHYDRPRTGYRLNDRDPGNFGYQSNSNKPWDYNSFNRFGDRRPSFRPGSDYPKETTGKYPSDKADYDKQPHDGRLGYGSSKPNSENSFQHGGNRYSGSENDSTPDSVNSGNLFYPNNGNQDINYPTVDNRPEYPSSSSRPSGYPGTGNPNAGAEKPTEGNPTIIYTGGRPSSGSGSTGGSYGSVGGSYPSGATKPGGYSFEGGYSEGNRPSGGHAGGGSRPEGGYSGSGNRPEGGYTGSNNRPEVYPSGGPRPGGNQIISSRPYEYISGTRPNGYSISRPNKYPGGSTGYGGNRPDGNYFSGGSQPSYYSDNGYSYSGSRPTFSSGDRFGYSSQGPQYYGTQYPDRYANNRYGYDEPVSFVNSYPQGGQSGGYGSTGLGGSLPIRGSNTYKGGYYTAILTEIGPDGRPTGVSQTSYSGEGHFGDKNKYPGANKNFYPYGGINSNTYPYNGKDRFTDDRYPSGGGYGYGGGYSYGGSGSAYGGGGNGFGGRDRFYYYGQDVGRDRYPEGYSYGGGDKDQSSNNDKNFWNYGDRKDGIYRRSGGSYPPYRGGPYYTSSYLASLSTTSGSTQIGVETKTQSVTKSDEVTQPTSESS